MWRLLAMLLIPLLTTTIKRGEKTKPHYILELGMVGEI